MEQNKNYFEQTALSLQRLNQEIANLDAVVTHEIAEKNQITDEMSSLKKELKNKASQIDSIIEKLNGVLK